MGQCAHILAAKVWSLAGLTGAAPRPTDLLPSGVLEEDWQAPAAQDGGQQSQLPPQPEPQQPVKAAAGGAPRPLPPATAAALEDKARVPPAVAAVAAAAAMGQLSLDTAQVPTPEARALDAELESIASEVFGEAAAAAALMGGSEEEPGSSGGAAAQQPQQEQQQPQQQEAEKEGQQFDPLSRAAAAVLRGEGSGEEAKGMLGVMQVRRRLCARGLLAPLLRVL